MKIPEKIRRHWRRAWNSFASFIVLVVPTLVLAVCVGLLTDALKGELLFRQWWGIEEGAFDSRLWRAGFVPVLLVALAAAWWLYKILPERWPVRALSQKESPAPHAVLILLVSDPRPSSFEITAPVTQRPPVLRFTEKCFPDDSGTFSFLISGNIERDIKALEELKTRHISRRFMWNWQQMLRSVAPHSSVLRRIYLLGSPGPGGSYQQLEHCEALLRCYCGPQVEIFRDEGPDKAVDFENVEKLCRAIMRHVKTATDDDFAEPQIMIDATGGMKTTSIAAALVTLHNRVKFQYVNNDGKVMAYEMFFDAHPYLAA